MKITHLFAIVSLLGMAAFSSGCASQRAFHELRDEVAALSASHQMDRREVVGRFLIDEERIGNLEKKRAADMKGLIGNDQILASRVEGLETALAPKPRPKAKAPSKKKVLAPAKKPDCAEDKK